MNSKPLLNILIRTSNRPNYFARLLDNLEGQFYKNIKLIISADTPESADYAWQLSHKRFNTTIHTSIRLERSENQTFPWNLYLNDLMSLVSDGWILFMDDDDGYAHQMALKLIADNIPDPESMLVWQMRFPDGRLVPSPKHIGLLPFSRKQIGMPCFAFHSKHKTKFRFDGMRAGDFRFAMQMLQHLKVDWLELPLVQLDNYGNAGKNVDLKVKNKLV